MAQVSFICLYTYVLHSIITICLITTNLNKFLEIYCRNSDMRALTKLENSNWKNGSRSKAPLQKAPGQKPPGQKPPV